MNQYFNFDFARLSFENQRSLYSHLDPECFAPEKLNQASNLEELMDCYYEDGNKEVYRLSYLAAMLAHEVATLIKTPVERDGEKYTLINARLNKGFDLGNDFDIEWYNGLNAQGYGVISLVDTVEMYRLEELKSLFENYSFLSVGE
jgi:hypothetical protein